MSTRAYTGRFAPSPTGALHLGSVIAAIGSYLDARAHQGRWLLRFDDLDTPRNEPGAVSAILNELQRLELHWDGEPWYQSRHPDHYQDALQHLTQQGYCYPCACSRKALRGGIYPGTCREGLAAGQTARSLRLRVGDIHIAFDDLIQGPYTQDLAVDSGDFIILRSDGIVAYHLATVLDDALARVNRIVRGTDLITSTPRQIYLQHCLGVDSPEYAHLPLAMNNAGSKLSKQTHAQPSSCLGAAELWRLSLDFLGQPSPPAQMHEISDLREFAVEHWRLDQVPKRQDNPLIAPCLV